MLHKDTFGYDDISLGGRMYDTNMDGVTLFAPEETYSIAWVAYGSAL